MQQGRADCECHDTTREPHIRARPIRSGPRAVSVSRIRACARCEGVIKVVS